MEAGKNMPRSMLPLLLLLALVAGSAGSSQARAPLLDVRPATLAQPGLPSSNQQPVAAPQATGNLSISKLALAQLGGAIASRPISYTLFYGWRGDAAAPNVVVADEFPSEIAFDSSAPAPTSRNGNTLSWNVGTLDDGGSGVIVITGTVEASLAEGTIITNTVRINGGVTDTDATDNQASVAVTVESPKPNFWIFKSGLLEEFDEGNFFTAEQNVTTEFQIYYFNFSNIESPDTQLVDTLPPGVEFISADPPAVRDGQRVIWNLGTVNAYGNGTARLRTRPTVSGAMTNTATISSPLGDRRPADNTASFRFTVVPLLMPRLIKPLRSQDSENPLIVSANPTFQGLAKAGSTVTLYRATPDAPDVCFGDFANCRAEPIGSAVTGADRSWAITPTVLTETKTYSLYLRAEFNGEFSKPPFGFWEPFFVHVDPRFEQAGFDADNFVIGSGDREVRPGGLGGQSGTTPNLPLTVKMRQKMPPDLPQRTAADPVLRAQHNLELRITEGGRQYTETLVLDRVEPVQEQSAQASGADPAMHDVSGNFVYVHKGFGPGAKVEIWCQPFFYDHETGLPIFGLVYVKCHEIVIDPAGYVYDIDTAGRTYEWPEVPPSNALLTTATVTATVRTGDDLWNIWDASRTGQVNPQVTDTAFPDRIFVPGYFAFYVPPGQYQLEASAPGCADYLSSILTVVDAPIFHNIGMRCSAEADIGIPPRVFLPLVHR